MLTFTVFFTSMSSNSLHLKHTTFKSEKNVIFLKNKKKLPREMISMGIFSFWARKEKTLVTAVC